MQITDSLFMVVVRVGGGGEGLEEGVLLLSLSGGSKLCIIL